MVAFDDGVSVLAELSAFSPLSQLLALALAQQAGFPLAQLALVAFEEDSAD